MKILALTDLTTLSKVGVLYAAKLSEALNAKLIVINILTIDKLSQIRSGYNLDDEIIKRQIKNREKECLRFIEEIRRETQCDFQIEILVEKGGFLEETVNKFASVQQCDLIVMSTKGASNLKKTIFGSIAATVVGDNSSIPVLTVPEFAFFKGFKDIVYASDMNRLQEEIEKLLPMAKTFNAFIHVLNIYKNNTIPKDNEEALAEKLKSQFNYKKIDCIYVLDSEVKRGINQYLNGRNTDVIAMFSSKRNFFERIFKRSSSREMVSHSNVPILTFSNSEAVVLIR